MTIARVRYDEVREGDKVFNDLAYHPRASWVEVIAVTAEGDWVELVTPIFKTGGHPRQGVTIKRTEETP